MKETECKRKKINEKKQIITGNRITKEELK